MGKLRIYEQEIEARPDELGFIPQKIAELDRHYTELIEEKRLQGAAYLLSRDKQVFAHKAMGKLRPGDRAEDFRPDSIMRIASITKLFTATAVMQLVDRGVIRVEQFVKELLEEFDHPLFEKITLFHLLTHTSDICPDPGSYFEPYPVGWGRFDNENWVEEVLRGHTRVEPGKEWSYSSAGFILLGEIISRVSGLRYEEYVRENILKPLEMEDSFFEVPEDKISRICLFGDISEEEALKWVEEFKNRPEYSPPASGGGMFSTLSDLQHFASMILNKGQYKDKRILSRKSVETMTRNHLNGIRDYCWDNYGAIRTYGLGFRVQSDFLLLTPGSVSHEGSGLSAFYIDPEEKLVFIIFGPLYKGVDWETRAICNAINIAWSGLI